MRRPVRAGGTLLSLGSDLGTALPGLAEHDNQSFLRQPTEWTYAMGGLGGPMYHFIALAVGSYWCGVPAIWFLIVVKARREDIPKIADAFARRRRR
jgi:hypothetical protein